MSSGAANHTFDEMRNEVRVFELEAKREMDT